MSYRTLRAAFHGDVVRGPASWFQQGAAQVFPTAKAAPPAQAADDTAALRRCILRGMKDESGLDYPNGPWNTGRAMTYCQRVSPYGSGPAASKKVFAVLEDMANHGQLARVVRGHLKEYALPGDAGRFYPKARAAFPVGSVVNIQGGRRRYVVTCCHSVGGRATYNAVALTGGERGSNPTAMRAEDLALANDQTVSFSGAAVGQLRRRYRNATNSCGVHLDRCI